MCVLAGVRPQAWPPSPVLWVGPSPLQGGHCEEETVRFGLEVLYVDSWARRRIYGAFKDVLGSGMHHHLQVEWLTGKVHPACLLRTGLS